MNPMEPLLRRAARDDATDETNGSNNFIQNGAKNSKSDYSFARNLKKKKQQVYDDETDTAESCCSCCCARCRELSYGERLFGCGTCLVLGCIVCFESLVRLGQLVTGRPLPFVAIWIVGHAISLTGSLFFKGPSAQFKLLLHPSRLYAAYVYLLTVGITGVIAALCYLLNRPSGIPMGLMLVALMAVQCLAVAWYTLSFVPLAREVGKWLFFLNGSTQIAGNASDVGSFRWGIGGARDRHDYDELL